ncbi:MAG: hypothetical protein ABEJ56_04565 [Candidatus Nanohaloarchaea archaeon]
MSDFIEQYKSAFKSLGFEENEDYNSGDEEFYLEKNGQIAFLEEGSGYLMNGRAIDIVSLDPKELSEFSVPDGLEDSKLLIGDAHPDHANVKFDYGEYDGTVEEHVDAVVDVIDQFDSLLED